ncbi:MULTISPECIES: M23 family metallopeptidase [unclassified Gilliamella]|uniref:M23 family metallopeptidase n=1 Tax=unclassified Gilliamella TaxID=2685620 RepID=UPI0013084526|nr:MULTISPECIES: M23 family metallopeptidase [unclassified Gilliamella]MWP50364.1 peptidoglycan DD-metalloendopeptidase family protein [Gilliamella sp. Lep-s35]MWP70092.1 peptidoglycan DD-metalloendopeptidase family protein [Gilliamella sp. Lep-s5]MWP78322.1 peptidoglycan DD-metalloendopeptidase family protein [Gilliamella sp. Lep-s21]
MENESLPTENIKSSNDQSEIVDSYTANPNQIVYDMVHQDDFIINVADAYFAKKVNAPNKPNEYTYVKLNQASLGDKVYLVAKCYGTPRKGKLVLSLKEIENTDTTQNLYSNNPVPFLVNGEEKTEMEYTLDGSITYTKEIELRPKDDKKYQELQDKLNSLENKSTHLTIRTEIEDTNATKVNFKSFLTGEFDTVKGSRYYDFLIGENESFQITPIIWHDPIDNPQRTYYNSSAIHKEQNGAFGMVRKYADGSDKAHQGLDIFANINTPCKACLDGEIVSYSNEGQKGYGNVLVLKVKGEDLRSSRRDYKLEFPKEIESGPEFDMNADYIYLRYAHLNSAVLTSGEVKSGSIIAYSGDTGNAKGVINPHLHFEIAKKPLGNGKCLINRYNPAFFVRLKPINEEEQTKVKKERQRK